MVKVVVTLLNPAFPVKAAGTAGVLAGVGYVLIIGKTGFAVRIPLGIKIVVAVTSRENELAGCQIGQRRRVS